MEGASGNSSSCSDFSSHSALGRFSGDFVHQRATVYPDLGQACSGTSLSCAHPFGNPYCGCLLSYPHHVSLQQKAYPAKYTESSGALPAEELSSRSKDLCIYPSFARSYKTAPGCWEAPVVPGVSAHPESRHDALIPTDRFQHWAVMGWDEELYCSKEQTHFNHLRKSQFSDAVPQQTEINGFRRGRKKRVPYNKTQLKELEKEFAACNFITRDKRRRISAATSLSERQVTIWFQNRRVKEKKCVCGSKQVHPS